MFLFKWYVRDLPSKHFWFKIHFFFFSDIFFFFFNQDSIYNVHLFYKNRINDTRSVQIVEKSNA